ncbi:MAG: response regulator transcription factor [Muribaculaceae bacterium]|nr:response regulator transcription factor [Muribaculaceae bacterium]MCI9054822.1 response regulator transcription factor [Muribaculaceae bacterium]
MKAKILFVEDERDLSLIVCDTLRQQGYEVAAAFDGIGGLAEYRAAGADLVVADVMMPRMDGFAMAKEIRRTSPDVPIIFLTAKSTIDDVEQGFDIGANDYLKKPFELRELLVRIKALLRNKATSPGASSTYVIGGYRFDSTGQLLIFNGKETEISNIEARLLEKLAANIGRTVDASALMIAVWGRDEVSNRNSLHGYIHKLRRALRHDPDIRIVNQRGFGYMLSVRER